MLCEDCSYYFSKEVCDLLEYATVCLEISSETLVNAASSPKFNRDARYRSPSKTASIKQKKNVSVRIVTSIGVTGFVPTGTAPPY